MARGFTFRLEALRRVRQQKLDEARRVVAERMGRINKIQNQIETCRENQRDSTRELRLCQEVPTPDVHMLVRHRLYIGAMEHAILDHERDLAQEQEHLRTEQEALVEANKQVKVLDKLREKQFDRWKAEQDRRERIENDEVSLTIYRRNQLLEASQT